MSRLNPEAGPVELDHCPTCGQQWLACGAIWPPSRADVTTTRCQLPRGHRSEEHWHTALWPRPARPDLAGRAGARPRHDPVTECWTCPRCGARLLWARDHIRCSRTDCDYVASLPVPRRTDPDLDF